MNIILRYIIVSILYMYSINYDAKNESLDNTINYIISNLMCDDIYVSREDTQYIELFIQFYENNNDYIEAYIDKYIKNNSIKNIGNIQGIIIKCGYISIAHFKEDAPLVIYEYITVANMYDINKRTSGMINQIIDNISKDIKK